MVRNTGLGFISGRFSNLAQGQVVTLTYQGEAYQFAANYYGGTGNDLVLQWANIRAYGWGNNALGQLGSGNTAVVRSPVPVTRTGVLANKTIVAISGGNYFSLALCTDGTVAAWGSNNQGQLGNNSTTNSSVPVDITRSGVLADKTVVAVSAGYQHALALCADGTVASWGANGNGQLGSGSNTQSWIPVAVATSGVLAGRSVVAISAGSYFSLALCADGAAVTWGTSGNGQLGNSLVGTESNVPVNVTTTGVLAGKTVTAIAAGYTHAAALCSDGTLVGWGSNWYGESGGASNTTIGAPVLVSPLGVLAGKTITTISAGNHHNLALCTDGTLAAWGYNNSGQLGNGSYTDSGTPVAVTTAGVLLGKTVTGIAAGYSHSTARCSNGLLAAWGSNTSQEYGNNTTVSYGNLPVAVVTTAFGQEPCVAIMAGHSANHTFALTAVQPPSSVATLAALTLDSGTLRPAFAPGTTAYTASVAVGTTTVAVRPTATSGKATIKVNGATVTSGAASGPLTLGPGATAITVAVTAEDGITITSYSISVDNFAPVFGGYGVVTPYQKPVAILVRKLLAKASDPDGDALSVAATGPAANGGTVVVQGSSVLYTPANNFSGADTFPVTITDARGASVVGTVTVTVGSGPSAGGVGANPPVLTVLPDGKMALAFQGIPGRSYIVQRSASGLDNWVTLATIPADASGKVAYTDESPPAGSAFYRLGMQ